MRLFKNGKLNADACNAFGIYILEKNLPENTRKRLYDKVFAICKKEAELAYKRMKVNLWSQHFEYEIAEEKARILFFNRTLANIIYDIIRLKRKVRVMEGE